MFILQIATLFFRAAHSTGRNGGLDGAGGFAGFWVDLAWAGWPWELVGPLNWAIPTSTLWALTQIEMMKIREQN